MHEMRDARCGMQDAKTQNAQMQNAGIGIGIGMDRTPRTVQVHTHLPTAIFAREDRGGSQIQVVMVGMDVVKRDC